MPANDNTGAPTTTALFCASCGCANVTASSLAGGEAHCNVCGWKGRVEELAAFAFSHDLGTPEQVLQRLFLDMRKMLAAVQFAQTLGVVLIQWGFLESPTGKNNAFVTKHLARYVGAAAKAIVESVIKTRAEIEKEQHDAPSTAPSA